MDATDSGQPIGIETMTTTDYSLTLGILYLVESFGQ